MEHRDSTPNLTTHGIKNTTKIASVLQNKAFMKKESRYKKLFKLDDQEDDENPLEKTHIGILIIKISQG